MLHAPLGHDERASASVARGRPLVDRAPPTVPAEQSGRAKDDVDSEQEVAAAVQSIVHASTAGGFLGHGPGGDEGSGTAGSGGTAGPGSRSHPMGREKDLFLVLDRKDPRFFHYTPAMLAKLSPFWEHAFPRSAALEGQQGVAIVSLLVTTDGSVHDVRVTRPSGIPEYDENVRRAILRAAPFRPSFTPRLRTGPSASMPGIPRSVDAF